MPTLTDLSTLIQEFAAAIPDLNLTGDEQEEYSTVLAWLQSTVDTGDPNPRIANECIEYLRRYPK